MSGSNADTSLGTEPEASATTPTEILCQAIARKMCISATYNGKSVTLAPHIVFTRHDAEFLYAVTVEQDGKKPKMAKLGTFKLTGLTGVAATTKLFIPQRSFNADDPQYVGQTVCVLKPV